MKLILLFEEIQLVYAIPLLFVKRNLILSERLQIFRNVLIALELITPNKV